MVRIIILIGELALYLYYSVVTYDILEYGIGARITIILGMIFGADLISTIVHELGHLFGGFISRHKLITFQIGIFSLTRFKEESRLNISKWNNQCLMVPDKKIPAFTLYQMGGIILNFLASVLFAYLGYFHLRHGSLLFLFLCALIVTGICKIAGNGIPIYKDKYPLNDMAYEKVLEKSRITREEYFLYLWCVESIINGEDISDIKKPFIVEDDGYCDLFWRKIMELKKCSEMMEQYR